MFTTALTSARHLFLSWAISIQSIPPTSYFLKIHINIILLSTPGSPKWSLSLKFLHQNPVYASPLSHTRYMPRPSHSSRFYHPHNIGWGVQIIQLLIMQFPPLPCYLVPPRPKYSPRHSILEHPQHEGYIIQYILQYIIYPSQNSTLKMVTKVDRNMWDLYNVNNVINSHIYIFTCFILTEMNTAQSYVDQSSGLLVTVTSQQGRRVSVRTVVSNSRAWQLLATSLPTNPLHTSYNSTLHKACTWKRSH